MWCIRLVGLSCRRGTDTFPMVSRSCPLTGGVPCTGAGVQGPRSAQQQLSVQSNSSLHHRLGWSSLQLPGETARGAEREAQGSSGEVGDLHAPPRLEGCPCQAGVLLLL